MGIAQTIKKKKIVVGCHKNTQNLFFPIELQKPLRETKLCIA